MAQKTANTRGSNLAPLVFDRNSHIGKRERESRPTWVTVFKVIKNRRTRLAFHFLVLDNILLFVIFSMEPAHNGQYNAHPISNLHSETIYLPQTGVCNNALMYT